MHGFIAVFDDDKRKGSRRHTTRSTQTMIYDISMTPKTLNISPEFSPFSKETLTAVCLIAKYVTVWQETV